jgi:prevent-host-death family protein
MRGHTMTITTISSREFNQDTGRAKKATAQGPVIITDRGEPAHVLLSIKEYRLLSERPGSIIERLGLPAGVEDVELEIPPRTEHPRIFDFD